MPWEDIATNNSVFAGDYVIEEQGAACPYYHCPKAVFEAKYEEAKKKVKKDEPKKETK